MHSRWWTWAESNRRLEHISSRFIQPYRSTLASLGALAFPRGGVLTQRYLYMEILSLQVRASSRYLAILPLSTIVSKIGPPSTIRTCDSLLRRQVLYPSELWADCLFIQLFSALKHYYNNVLALRSSLDFRT